MNLALCRRIGIGVVLVLLSIPGGLAGLQDQPPNPFRRGRKKNGREPEGGPLGRFLKAPSAKIKNGNGVSLTYDFSDEGQLAPFEIGPHERDRDGLVLPGTVSSPAALGFLPPLTGDFTVVVRFVVLEDPNRGSGAIWLRTAESPDDPDAGGVGVGLARSSEWRISIGRFGRDAKILSEEKKVDVPARSPLTLRLRRDRDRVTAQLGIRTAVSAREAGWERFHVRLGTARRIRVTRLEIHGTLDPGWVRSIRGPRKPSRIPPDRAPNGRDLNGWIVSWGREPRLDGEGFIFEAPPGEDLVMVHRKLHGVETTTFTMVVDIQKMHEWPEIGFGVVVSGMSVAGEGSVRGMYGRHYTMMSGMHFDELDGSKWKAVVRKRTPGFDLRHGRNRIELIRNGGTLTLRANGAREIRSPDKFIPPDGEIRIAIFLEDVEGRIVKVTWK